MRKHILLLVYLFLVSCIDLYGQDNCSKEKLVQYFKTSEGSKDSIAKVNYFYCFPNTFQEFIKLYGEVKSPLYEGHYQHIVEFDRTFEYIPQKDWVTKLISLSQGGKWDADAVFMLQAVIMSQFKNKGEVFLEEFKKYNKEEVYNFFYFYLDTVHPNYTHLPKEFDVLSGNEKKIALRAMEDVNKKYK